MVGKSSFEIASGFINLSVDCALVGILVDFFDSFLIPSKLKATPILEDLLMFASLNIHFL